MDRITAPSEELLDESGPGSIGFYTNGQLFLKEYYTLSVIARAGIGTNHLDGNTRLCTATAAEALRETFGCDGQPASYTDIDHAEVHARDLVVKAFPGADYVQHYALIIASYLAMTDRPADTVTYQPPAVRRSISLRAGTNVALLDALLHEIIQTDRIDRDFVEAHTVGFEELADRVTDTTPAWTARICDVPAGKIADAAEILGGAEHLTARATTGSCSGHDCGRQCVAVPGLRRRSATHRRSGRPDRQRHASKQEYTRRSAPTQHGTGFLG
jgi:anaerobic selenocysteine-containing dehydrogenase